jgi:hypothetical protein
MVHGFLQKYDDYFPHHLVKVMIVGPMFCEEEKKESTEE